MLLKTQRFTGLCIGIFLLVGSANAQIDTYMTSMKENFAKLASGDSLPLIAAQFERIAQSEQTKWVPYYYASYYDVVQTMSMKDSVLREHTLDHAQQLLDMAVKLSPDSSEILVIQGFLFIARLQIAPMIRGAEYIMKVHDAFDTAMKLNPNNPRSYYMKGVTVLNTPEYFGGGKEPAKPILTKALQLYENFVPAAPFYPNWGKEDCQKLVALCQQ